MTFYEEAQYEKTRLQAQVLNLYGDSEAWCALARYVTRHGGSWKETWTCFQEYLRTSPQADKLALLRNFLRHCPDREKLLFLHWPGHTPQAVQGPLRNVMYQLGYRNLMLRDLPAPVPWSNLRAMRWAFECLLHSCGLLVLRSASHGDPQIHHLVELLGVLCTTLRGIHRIAMGHPPPHTPEVFRQLADRFEASRATAMARDAQSERQMRSFVWGVRHLLDGKYGAAVERMLSVVPNTVRDDEKQWQRMRLWEHLTQQVPPPVTYVGGFLPDWANSSGELVI